MAVVQSWVLVKVRLWLGITVLVRPRLSDSGDVAKTMSRELQSARVLNNFLWPDPLRFPHEFSRYLHTTAWESGTGYFSVIDTK